MKLRHILSLAAMLALPAAAQTEVSTTYFMNSSTSRHDINPALLDKPYVSMPLLPLGDFSVGTTGNIGLKKFVYKMGPDWQGYGENGNTLTTFMHPNVDAGEFLGGLKDKNRLSVNLKYQLFGFGFKAFGGINSVELNVRSNTNLCLPKTLFEFMKNIGSQEYDITNLGVRTENYAELGLGHSHKIDDKWTVGGKLKFLFGLAYADVSGKDVRFQLSDDKWQVSGDVQAVASIMKTEFKQSDKTEPVEDVQPGELPRHRIKELGDFKGGLAGFGMAVDLGATYKVMEDLTVSAALTDLGFINWSNAQHASSAGHWEFEGFGNGNYGEEIPINQDGRDLGDQFKDLGDDLGDAFAVYDDGVKSATRALAATLSLGAEYTLPAYRNLRFGFLYQSRMAGRHSYHQGRFSANVAPVKWFDASLSMGFTSTGVQGGLVASLHAKHFNFTIGTDRFFGKFSKQGIPLNRANSNIAIGMSFPL